VLGGLALEQFSKIEKCAKALKKLSEVVEWQVGTIPVGELVKQSKAKKISCSPEVASRATTLFGMRRSRGFGHIECIQGAWRDCVAGQN
jgi:hypothetical protein